ncbi:dihydrodipicolinate synthase family protein [Martelella alba]|uniref:Dihydrodipicolinate synthase family protein n=1 Tax=Martelella alba TaxID=2590451 RepID=A0ABY2SLH6_9HYPH|nr:dihydrodipicolinate synthase family protein [Martelella alba]TKI04313.1 dihydrodipicolinate synthase family protein [Martelella alba]
MSKWFPDGVWPVMLTPFKHSGEVDYAGLARLVEWYIDQGVAGLFAVCQSSEQFFLSPAECAKVAEAVKTASRGRVPVIASGHISDTIDDQINELRTMEQTGAEALILITNRLAKENESDEQWINHCRALLDNLDPHTALGLYECPYPYKRLLSEKVIDFCLSTGKFYFIKDTCCDAKMLQRRIEQTKNSQIKIYNANATTLLASLRMGAAGYSGVMANFHPRLYVWLCEHYQDAKADELAAELSIMSLIERQYYPVNAKYYLSDVIKLPMGTASRQQDEHGLTDTYKQEVRYISALTKKLEKQFY